MINQERAAASTIMVTVLTSLLISSALISWFLLQIYGVSVAGIGVPLTGTSFQSEQDFKTNSSYDTEIITFSNGNVWRFKEGIGYELYNNVIGKEYIYFDYVSSDVNGNYINKYTINNTVHSNFDILVRNAHDYGAYAGDIFLRFEGDEIRVITPAWIGTKENDVQFYSGVTDIDYPIVYTTFNDQSNTLTYQIGSIEKTIPNIENGGISYGNFGENIVYGGIGADTNGFAIDTFKTESGIMAVESAVDSAVAFGTTILKLVVWNVDPRYFPTELNLILIKSQTLALAVSVFFFFRGGE